MLLRMVLMLIDLAFGGSGQTIADGLNPNSAIYQQVKALDDRIFQAYNTCDLTTLAGMVDDNLEFYHDKTGLSLGRSSFIIAIKNNICHKVKRELVGSTLEVFPLQDYGAIEVGSLSLDARRQLRSLVRSRAQGDQAFSRCSACNS